MLHAGLCPRRRSILIALVCAAMLTVVSSGAAARPAAAATLVPNLLKDINPGAGSSTPSVFVQKGAEVFFLTGDALGAPGGLWKTDGTTAGTVLVKAASFENTPELVLVGGTLFFAAGGGGLGVELWKSDGTTAGTVPVKDIVPGSNGSQPTNLIAVGSTLFFSAFTPEAGRELWKSDGTAAGTVLVKDINTETVNLPPPGGTGPGSSNPGTLQFSSAGGATMIAYGNTLLFAATDGDTASTGNGVELWRSDGTTAGTVMVTEINPDCTAFPNGSALNANPSNMVLFGGRVLFTATEGVFRCGPPASGLGTELWATDGTAAGTVLVENINPGDGSPSSPSGLTVLGSTVVFSANDGTNGTELWRTDGTEAGTVLVKDINTTTPTASSFSFFGGTFAVAGGVAYFGATDGTTAGFHGHELWKTDGTALGTVLVKDINPGPEGSNPLPSANGAPGVGRNYAAVGNDLYFTANTPTYGNELWKTDGTDAGTVLTRDIDPGSESSSPTHLTSALGSVFFSADDGTTGREPWVLRTNQPIAGANDAYFTDVNTPLTVPAPGVLGNDTDPDGGTLVAGAASDPPSGTVTVNPDGSFTYTPDAGFIGTDTFTYQVSDGQGATATQTVTIRVLGTTEVASVRGEACSYQVKVGLFGGGQGISGCSELTGFPAAPRPPGPTPAPGSPAANDTSYSPHVVLPPSGGTMTATDPNGAKGEFGPAVIHGGMWPDDVGSPPPSGPQSASATGNLASGTVTATADITLDAGVPGSETPNDGPGGYGPFPVQGESLHAECSATKTGVSGSATFVNATTTTRTDEFGGPLPAFTEPVPNSPPVNYTRHGVITNVGDVFTVVYNEHIWNDDGSLTVNAVHMYLFGPVAVGEVIRGQVTCGTTPSPVPPPDIQGPTCGTPVVQPNGPSDPTPREPRTELVGVFDTGGLQSITNIQATNATVSVGQPPPAPQYLQFTPGMTGPLPVTAVRDDPDLPMHWSFDAIDEAGNVTRCRGVLAPPVAVDDTYAGTAGTPVVVAAPGVLENDTDADGDTLTAGSAGTPGNGNVVLNADGSFTYTPGPDFTGDCFTYVVTDTTGLTDTGSVRITSGPAPVACDDSYSTNEDTTLTVAAPGMLGNDVDPDGDELNVEEPFIFTDQGNFLFPNRDGSFEYTPSFDFSGVDTFTYTVSDGNGNTDTATVTITVNAVNDAPFAADDEASTNEDTPVTIAAPGVLDNDFDPEGATLTAGSASNPAGGSVTLNPDGSYTYTPDANFSGTDTFTYTVSDGTLTDTGLVTITVTGTPDPSVAVDDAYSTTEDTTLTVPAPGVLANDTDPDGKTASGASDPANGSVTLNPDGSFTYTPDANFVGTDTFVYTVGGGGGATDIGQVTITVNPANDAPVAVDDVATTTEDTPVTVPIPGVLGNDTDADGNTLTAGAASNPAGGSVTLNANGSYTYTPDANFSGTDTFTYTVSDGNGGSDTGLVTVTVTAVADNPVAVDDVGTTPEDTAVTVAAPGVLGNDTDADGNTLTASGATTPANGTVTLNANGSYTYTPNANFSGTDTFSYTVNDGTGRTDTGLVTITVTATNGSAFHPLTPTRILDTRPAPNNVGPFNTPWGPGTTRDVTVTGAGVPAGADAVTLNVTVTGTTGNGFLTIWPKGQTQPVASNLNWAAGQTIPNAVTVKVGANGQISIANPVGSTQVIIDIVGYYDGQAGDGYTPLDPARILDSRPAPNTAGPFSTPWGPNTTRQVPVTGLGGVPANADAVVLNATVTGTTANGFLTIWPNGQAQPTASSLNWAPGQTIPNAVTVKVGTSGQVSVFNAVGNANVIFDVVGYFAPGTGHLFHPLNPARVLDTRPPPNQVGPFNTPWGPATNRDVPIGGNGGVPANAAAALLNVTVTGGTADSFLSIWPAGQPAPLVSSLNWAPGVTIPNSVTTKLPAAGAVTMRNHAGTVHVIADTNGWYG